MKNTTLIAIAAVGIIAFVLYNRNKKNVVEKPVESDINIKQIADANRPSHLQEPSIVKDLRQPITKSNLSVEPFAKDFDAHTMATVAQPKTLISPAGYKFNKTILLGDI